MHSENMCGTFTFHSYVNVSFVLFCLMSILSIFHTPFPLTLLQMRWECSSRKWVHLHQLCPSIIIISLASPVLTVSAFDDRFLQPIYNSTCWMSLLMAYWLSFLQCWQGMCWKVLRHLFLPSGVWSSPPVTWWTLASVSAIVLPTGQSFMAWTRLAFFLHSICLVQILFILQHDILWLWPHPWSHPLTTFILFSP